MSISVAEYGTTPDGRAVRAYTLGNDAGLSLTVLDYGATVISVKCPRGDGGPADEITLCRTSLAELTDRALNPYFGATVGRVANRIAGARFELDGATHTLAANFSGHCIHGGVKGWDQAVWRTVDMGLRSGGSDCFVTLRHASPAGDEGFPGAVTATATYSLSRDNVIGMAFTADVAGAASPVNICNHVYWCLGGVGRRVLDHELTVFAPLVVDVDATTQIPTGRMLPVTEEVGSGGAAAFDFRTPKPIGRHLEHVTGGGCPGYDHSFVLPHALGDTPAAAGVCLPPVDVPADVRAAAADLAARVDAWRRPALGAVAPTPVGAAAAGSDASAGTAAAAPKRSWLDDLLASDDDASARGGIADEDAAKHPALRWDAAFSMFTADPKPAGGGGGGAVGGAAAGGAATAGVALPRTVVSPAAVVADPGSGRRMTVFTSQPCVHVYTTNMLNQAPPFTKHTAVCLETQHPPDAVNQPLCGSIVVRPGSRYEHVTFHKLEWKPGSGTSAAAPAAGTAAAPASFADAPASP